MKTAVSVPNDVFEQAEKLARSAGRSRSEVYSTALREYVARHAVDDVTEAVNQVVERLGHDTETDGFLRHAATSTLGNTEW